jgi:hypothetical protein
MLKSSRFRAMVKEKRLSLPIPYLVWITEEKYQILYFTGPTLHLAGGLVKPFFGIFLSR